VEGETEQDLTLTCGDGLCYERGGEDASTCPQDCDYCGNSFCGGLEDYYICPKDCDACNNGYCGPYENENNCPQDCTVCGNGICGEQEDINSCPQDCSQICGNSVCSRRYENEYTCPEDCDFCGNSICSSLEDVNSCPFDCRGKWSGCGDSICNHYFENEISCPLDCTECGNNICGSDENEFSCPDDCTVCGNGSCGPYENLAICPQDCGFCGDGICEITETASSCPPDCPSNCGDGLCLENQGEDQNSCPIDCLICRDGECGIKENPDFCPQDCPGTCGDGVCNNYYGENDDSCPDDCIVCGDERCSLPENVRSCPQDCFNTLYSRKKLSAGSFHTCAITDSGVVKCWGNNKMGQLGVENLPFSNIPVEVNLPSKALDISAGGNNGDFIYEGHSCAVLDSGQVECWGANFYGQLGSGCMNMLSCANSSSPVYVEGLPTEEIASISAGFLHNCALTVSGAVYCWGDDSYGQIGYGYRREKASIFEFIFNFSHYELKKEIVKISAGGFHTCFSWKYETKNLLGNHRKVRCTGYNQYGQLGDGSTTDSQTLVDVILSPRVVDISAGWYHTCALLDIGTVKCWGNNKYGQLGDGTTIDSNVPVDVEELTEVIAISAGGWHTCALLGSGGVKCWGANSKGQLGNGSYEDSKLPSEVVELSSRVIEISAGGEHTCALLNTGEIKCWGNNEYGQLGNGSYNDSNIPVKVVGFGP